MKVCYLECFSGISGDMLLGGLVDAGAEADVLRQQIARENGQGKWDSLGLGKWENGTASVSPPVENVSN